VSTDLSLAAGCCASHSHNITGNLTPMLRAAGIDWSDYERGSETARTLLWDIITALTRLTDEPERFEAMNPPNGWGSREALLAWLVRVAIDCLRHPDAIVEVSR
jgi:hypothetical protein